MMNPRKYRRMAELRAPHSPHLKNVVWAFLVGGALCAAAEWLILFAEGQGMSAEDARLMGSFAVVLLTVILTGAGVYDKIAAHAGAGVIVPISGFANSMTCTAIEFKSEGLVLGLASNMFKIAGPVIVYGTVASVVYGLIYWLMQMI